jgi:serine kinase of HPr protein (carbohydrate metabolism regulator)
MTIATTAAVLKAEIAHNDFEDSELTGAYTSDLLSDVMANAKDSGALITIQAHKNTVAVAVLAGITVIILCNNRPIPEDMLKSAKDEGIAILRTPLNQFQVSGLLYALFQEDQR